MPRKAGWFGLPYLIAEWKLANPGAELQTLAGSGPLAGASMPEQLSKFLPDGTVITIRPPAPVKALMDDGTIITFQQVTGTYTTRSGQPTLVLSPPLPGVSAKKYFFRFGATINGGQYEPDPGVIAIDTSMGRYRMKLEPVK
jgi:hypothetical protein